MTEEHKIIIPAMSHERINANAEKAWQALMETPSTNEVLAALGMVTGWIHTELTSWKIENAKNSITTQSDIGASNDIK